MATKITIVGASNTFRVSEVTLESTYSFQGRLSDTPKIEARNGRNNIEKIREVPFEVNNRDGWIDILGESLWGKVVTIIQDGVSETWSGTITWFKQGKSGFLKIVATEQSSRELAQLLPDEILRVGVWANAEASFSNSVIPIPFGGTTSDPLRVVGMVVDRVNFRYLFCVGELPWRGNVYKNNELIGSGFTVYLGTSTQTNYPGFVYLEFAEDPRDDANSWPVVVMEITGVKLGTATESQRRNPMRILQYLLTTARTGVLGWGLGIDSARIDSTAFAQAIADCDTALFKLDGLIHERRDGLSWVNEILNSCRGSLPTVGGKYYPVVDKITASSKTFTSANMELLDWGKEGTSKRINRTIGEYRNRFSFSGFSYVGYQQRDDSTSQAAIGENEKRLRFVLVADHTTAGALLDYALYRSAYTEDVISFQTTDISGLENRAVITITYVAPGFSVTAKKYRIYNIIPAVTGCRPWATVQAESYDDDIFTINAIGTMPSDPIIDTKLHGPNVGVAAEVITAFTLSTGTGSRIDGTQQVYIDGAFTKGRNYAFGEIQYNQEGDVDGLGNPNWRTWGITPNSSFRFEPANPGKIYRFKILATGASGKQASAVEASNSPITADGGTTAPADVTNFQVEQDELNLRQLNFTWDAVNDPGARYQIRKGLTWATAPIIGEQISGTKFEWFETANGEYSYLIKAIDINQRPSVNEADTSIGLVIYPDDMLGFVASQNGANILLAWSPNPENDIRYEIREGSSWELGTEVIKTTVNISEQVTADFARTYTYWAKAKDSRGGYSENAVSSQLVVGNLLPKNYVVLKDEIANPTGTTFQTEIGAPYWTFETMPGTFADYPMLSFSDFPGQNVLKLAVNSSSIPGTLDYDEIASPTGSHSGTEIGATNFTFDNVSQGFQNHPTLTFEDFPSGDVIRLSAGGLSGVYTVQYDIGSEKTVQVDVDWKFVDFPYGAAATLELRISNDGLTWSAWTPFVSAVKAGRYFEFRLSITSPSTLLSPEVSSFEVSFAPYTGDDVYYDTGYYTVQYDIGQATTCDLAIDMFLFILPPGVSATADYRYSVDGVVWSAWEGFSASRKTFRYLEFRINLATDDNTLTPEVTRFQVAIDVPDIDQKGSQTIDLAGETVTFLQEYNFAPALVVTAEGSDAKADYSSVTNEGFFVTVVKASDGTPLDGKTINWLSRGY